MIDVIPKNMTKINQTISKLQKKIEEKADWKFVCSSLDKKAGNRIINLMIRY